MTKEDMESFFYQGYTQGQLAALGNEYSGAHVVAFEDAWKDYLTERAREVREFEKNYFQEI